MCVLQRGVECMELQLIQYISGCNKEEVLTMAALSSDHYTLVQP